MIKLLNIYNEINKKAYKTKTTFLINYLYTSLKQYFKK
jgi:ferric iron reductase protein FhuF